MNIKLSPVAVCRLSADIRYNCNRRGSIVADYFSDGGLQLKRLFLAVLLLLFVSCSAYADIIMPPSAWELLKERPQTEPTRVEVPDVKSGDKTPTRPPKPASDDVKSKDAGARTPGK